MPRLLLSRMPTAISVTLRFQQEQYPLHLDHSPHTLDLFYSVLLFSSAFSFMENLSLFLVTELLSTRWWIKWGVGGSFLPCCLSSPAGRCYEHHPQHRWILKRRKPFGGRRRPSSSKGKKVNYNLNSSHLFFWFLCEVIKFRREGNGTGCVYGSIPGGLTRGLSIC